MWRWAAAAGLAVLFFSGCATIIEGTEQNIHVDVVPTHGVCVISRQGQVIGQSVPGHRYVKVSKSMHDLEFDCTASGYTPKRDVLTSSLSPATVASFFLLDFGLVDAATGAWKKYPERLTVVMAQAPSAAAPRR